MTKSKAPLGAFFVAICRNPLQFHGIWYKIIAMDNLQKKDGDVSSGLSKMSQCLIERGGKVRLNLFSRKEMPSVDKADLVDLVRFPYAYGEFDKTIDSIAINTKQFFNKRGVSFGDPHFVKFFVEQMKVQGAMHNLPKSQEVHTGDMDLVKLWEAFVALDDGSGNIYDSIRQYQQSHGISDTLKGIIQNSVQILKGEDAQRKPRKEWSERKRTRHVTRMGRAGEVNAVS